MTNHPAMPVIPLDEALSELKRLRSISRSYAGELGDASDEMPHHGRVLVIDTPRGPRRIRSRASREALETLARVYCETGCAKEAAQEAGIKRRTGHAYLDKMDLIERDKRRRELVTYTFEMTGKSLQTLYPWGTVHRAVELYWEELYTTRMIEDETGVPSYTVWSWMKKLGIARSQSEQYKLSTARKAGFSSRSELKAEVRRLYRDGASVEDVARVLEIGRSTVCRLLNDKWKRAPEKTRELSRKAQKRYGTAPRPWQPGSGADPEAIEMRRRRTAELAEQGVKPIEIADKLDCSIATVYNDLSRETSVAQP